MSECVRSVAETGLSSDIIVELEKEFGHRLEVRIPLPSARRRIFELVHHLRAAFREGAYQFAVPA